MHVGKYNTLLFSNIILLYSNSQVFFALKSPMTKSGPILSTSDLYEYCRHSSYFSLSWRHTDMFLHLTYIIILTIFLALRTFRLVTRRRSMDLTTSASLQPANASAAALRLRIKIHAPSAIPRPPPIEFPNDYY